MHRRRGGDYNIHVRMYKGLRIAGTLPDKNGRHAYNIITGWHQSTNYSWRILDTMHQFASITPGRMTVASGAGRYNISGAMIVDTDTSDFLTLPVITPLGNQVLIVSDLFDSPRCRPQYKAMRRHWRKAMLDFIGISGVAKIVKAPHAFLQKFKIQFNYVPDERQIAGLNHVIFQDTVENINRGRRRG